MEPAAAARLLVAREFDVRRIRSPFREAGFNADHFAAINVELASFDCAASLIATTRKTCR
ncbi:hypothetical protein [Paraburkholderia caledonica]|jgi:hypothetical protein|uniref:hypothetical protein n=1 Tax=Paraburkholderia caledonica TaxID=134536 RepID=UPI0012EBBD39|nr:hypothetical protein [Paraburkholderia caledonica]